MKNILILLVSLFVFVACSLVGYNLPPQNQGASPVATATAETGDGSINYKWLVIQVEWIDEQHAELLSVWFVSLYLDRNNKDNKLAVVSLYSDNQTLANKLRDTFKLNEKQEPASAFWKVLADHHDTPVEKFVMLDTQAFAEIIDWLRTQKNIDIPINPNTHQPDFSQLNKNGQTCLQSLKNNSALPENWDELSKFHIRSNVMGEAKDVWAALTDPTKANSCEVKQIR